MENLFAARALMGLSLAFHIVYATVGIGLPFLLMLAEGLALKTGDDSWHDLARGWIRPAGVLFAIGAVSGTILSFELGLLWPQFMAFSGPLIGLAFSMEGFAFFTEAIFLALYLYGERRLSRRALFLCTIPLSVAAAVSAVFVISANGWMNTPSGFQLVQGSPAGIDPAGAFFNPAWRHEAVHGTLAAYTATGFGMAGLYAAALLRAAPWPHAVNALRLTLGVATVALPLMLFSGDWAAVSVARDQKGKLAAMEAHFVTRPGAPLIIGGWPEPAENRVAYGIPIPKLLSLLAHRNPDSVVAGLDALPRADRPDPRLVHPFFDLMVLSFFVMSTAAGLFWWSCRRHGQHTPGRLTLRSVVIAAPFGLIALESGWMVTEFGRQPWVVQGYLRTSQGVTMHGGILLVFLTFFLVYLALTVAIFRLLLRPDGGSRKRPAEVVHE
ncbi:cytochrome ubiquinol oxidase subunit I [Geomesophilobacter sediminis]|uniref:Cytochrome ubiquinol oxidase subunit I n=1 Tax=Geomesophilobacter sediminis TaxID=2798584 RepID=A0A8J7INE1_9BACT|nr:cytochrome ubiquinol oxidase subunit I [Geomesophilobacter sediminis]MBJ6723544.1 cytochrome ubiquinol oxidase subunit I [Geomesophilobacter sediminis]